MAGEFGITMRVDWFFDRRKVTDPVERATRDYLRRAGGQVRLRARRSLRRRKRTSVPGRPPSIHAPGSRGLKLILFAMEPGSQSVIVGPVKFPAKGRRVPSVLEHGGATQIQAFGGGRTPGLLKKRVVMRRRPFMGPALDATESSLGPLWAESLRKQWERAAK